MPALRPLAEVIPVFGQPVLERLNPSAPATVLRQAYGFIVLVWNSSVLAERPWRRPEPMQHLMGLFDSSGMPLDEWGFFRMLMERKHLDFEFDNRGVGEWSLTEVDGAWHFACDERFPRNAAMPGNHLVKDIRTLSDWKERQGG